MKNSIRRGNPIRVALVTGIAVLAVALVAACAPTTAIEFRINSSNGDLEWKYVDNDTWTRAVASDDIGGLTSGSATAIINERTGDFVTQADLNAAVARAGGAPGVLSASRSVVEYSNLNSAPEPVTFRAGGFSANEMVRLELQGGTGNPVNTVQANSNGGVDFGEITLPGTAPTTPADSPNIVYTLRAVGVTSGTSAVAVVTVQDEIAN